MSGSWAGLGGYNLDDLALPAVLDEGSRFLEIEALDDWGEWCGYGVRVMGLVGKGAV